jgi:hypothetical protein
MNIRTSLKWLTTVNNDANKHIESTQVTREIEDLWRVSPCNLADTHGCLGEP